MKKRNQKKRWIAPVVIMLIAIALGFFIQESGPRHFVWGAGLFVAVIAAIPSQKSTDEVQPTESNSATTSSLLPATVDKYIEDIKIDLQRKTGKPLPLDPVCEEILRDDTIALKQLQLGSKGSNEQSLPARKCQGKITNPDRLKTLKGRKISFIYINNKTYNIEGTVLNVYEWKSSVVLSYLAPSEEAIGVLVFFVDEGYIRGQIRDLVIQSSNSSENIGGYLKYLRHPTNGCLFS